MSQPKSYYWIKLKHTDKYLTNYISPGRINKIFMKYNNILLFTSENYKEALKIERSSKYKIIRGYTATSVRGYHDKYMLYKLKSRKEQKKNG